MSVRTARVVTVLLGLMASASLCFAQGKSYQLERNELVLPSPIVFETGTDKLASSSESGLQHVKSYLEDKSYISRLRIEAHTDSQGSDAANQKLTEKRALAVGRWLVSKGIDCKRLLAVGFGESKPVASNDSPEGRAQNRRVSFVNAELRGRAIGGMPIDGGGQVAGDLCASSP